MKIAVMQPYFFPYIGYFQLMDAVDKFVIYDDVNYINRGWINRNNILVDGKPYLITLPLNEASQNKKIHELHITPDVRLIDKLLKTIFMNYKKTPYFEQVYDLIKRVFNDTSLTIAEFNLMGLTLINNYLEIETEIIKSSRRYNNSHLKGEERIIDICARESADTYINPIGGMELYHRNIFESRGTQLFFLKSMKVEYVQYNLSFVPWLSIIDVLMFNSIDRIKQILKQYQLV